MCEELLSNKSVFWCEQPDTIGGDPFLGHLGRAPRSMLFAQVGEIAGKRYSAEKFQELHKHHVVSSVRIAIHVLDQHFAECKACSRLAQLENKLDLPAFLLLYVLGASVSYQMKRVVDSK